MVWSHGACCSEVLAVLYKGKIRNYVKWSTCMNSAQCMCAHNMAFSIANRDMLYTP